MNIRQGPIIEPSPDWWVDDVTLIQEPVQTYIYDDNGNLKVTTNTEGTTSTTYDSSDRLKKYTAMNGVEYELSYTGTSRQPHTIVSDGITTTYTYDTAGNVTNTKVQAPDNGIYLESGAAYDSTKNFQTEATDTNGNTSYSTYNAAKGLLTSSTDPNGVTTAYTYNANNDRAASTYRNGNDKAYLFYQYDEKGRLKQLNRKDYLDTALTRQGYHFEYDDWGNTTSIKVGSVSSDTSGSLSSSITLSSYVYNANGTLASMNYSGGYYVTYAYDRLDRLVEEVYHSSGGSVQADYRYVYNANGQLAKQYAVVTNSDVETVTESYTFAYDSLGRLIRSREENNSSLVQRTEHLYDSANRLIEQNWSIGSSGFSEQYTYDSSDGTLEVFDFTLKRPAGQSDTYHLNYDYDSLNRMEKAAYSYGSNTTPIYTRNYAYLNCTGSSSRTTSRLGTYTVKYHDTDLLTGSQYAYDANGNITVIQEAYWTGSAIAYRPVAEYTYDELNQLKTETRKVYTGTSATPTTTTVVTYEIDTAGNISSVETKVNGVVTDTVAYTYGNAYWSDRLTKVTVNQVARTISYNSSGGYCNPVSWYNGTDYYSNLTWTQGRRLSSVTKGSDTYSYEYDMSGVRTVKIANGLRHEYVTQNGRVVRETVTNASTGAFRYALDFLYDEAGHPQIMRKYSNANMQNDYVTMNYVCNAQGDVVKLVYNGIVYAEYSYDAWGNVLTATEYGNYNYAALNPLRYRGYYYDTETGFYYLQSRYYDPTLKRFLNADNYASTGQGFIGYNMFAYCGNNPNLCIDESGDYPVWQTLFEDGDYGFIHRAVQSHITMKYPGIGKEGYIYNKTGDLCGRADLYEDDGSIWEIKTTKTGAAAANNQLMRYYGEGQTLGVNGPTTHVGAGGLFPGRFSGSFPLVCGEDSYTVVYYTPQPGVVLYNVQKNKKLELAPYAVYVPKEERSLSNQPHIGNIPVYAAVGIGALGAFAIWGGGGGYCFDDFLAFGY